MEHVTAVVDHDATPHPNAPSARDVAVEDFDALTPALAATPHICACQRYRDGLERPLPGLRVGLARRAAPAASPTPTWTSPAWGRPVDDEAYDAAERAVA